jgi:formate dehydrogenase subunit gamma
MSSLDDARLDRIDGLIAAQAGRPGALLPILHAIQDDCGYVPKEAVPRIALALNLSRAEVHGVISFYHYFRTHPPGEHVVQICRAEACQAMHCERTEEAARRDLGVDYGATTADGRFTLEPVYCLGNCAAGPSVMVDGKLYGRVTPERLGEILAQCGGSR